MKDIVYFSKNKSAKDGYKNYCKKCASEEARRYRDRHREDINRRKRISYEKSKLHAEEKTLAELKIGIKVCSTCKSKLPISEFYKRGNGGFYSQCKRCVIDAQEKYVKENHELIIKRKRDYHKRRKDMIDAYNHQYSKTHSAQNVARMKTWYHSNIIKARKTALICRKRRMSRENNLISDFTKEQWKICKDYFSDENGHYCAYCGKYMKRLTHDHFVPLISGGNYTANNILPVCLSCNSSKSSKVFIEWYKEKPFYSEKRIEKINKYFEIIEHGNTERGF